MKTVGNILGAVLIFAAFFASCDLFGTREEEPWQWQWEPQIYTTCVHYDANGGDGTMADQVFSSDKTQNLRPNAFTRTGYTFGGWATSTLPYAGIAYTDGQNFIGYSYWEEMITLYAVWRPNPYTVKYNANGGSGVMEDSVLTYGKEGSLAGNTFTRTGYDFAGWALSPDGAKEYEDWHYGSNLPGAAGGTVTLYAVWRVIACTVTYDANGGEGTMADTWLFADDMSTFLRNNAFVRPGYAFDGWAESAAGPVVYDNQQYVSNLTDTVGATVTLYAVWRARIYTVAYDAGVGGEGSMADSVFLLGVEHNLPPNAFTRANYVFLGWAIYSGSSDIIYTDEQRVRNVSGSNYYVTEGDTVTLYAIWSSRHAYTVVYNANGGDGTMEDSPFISGEAQNLRINAFTRTGYTFMGWTTYSAATTAAYTNGQSYTYSANTAGETITLYAVWRAIPYYVRYDANGGSGTMAASSFTYDTYVYLRNNAYTRTGYSFAGWATSPSGTVEYTNGQSIRSLTDITLYAVWKGNTYTVKYNANDGSGTMADSTFTYGTAQNLRENAFTRTGYTFIGWATYPSGTVVYTDQQSVSTLTATAGGTIYLYARWILRSDSIYTVKYSANGGSGTMANSTFIIGVSEKLAANVFTRAGYVFTGWAASSSGAVAYTDQQSVSNLTTATETVTLYAVWRGNAYTVAFNRNGGVGTMPNQSFIYGTAQNLQENTFTRTGYHLAGWATSSSATSAAYANGQSVSTLTATAGGTVTLYAVWQANTYTIIYNPNAANVTGTMENSIFTYGTTQTLRANAFTRTGYHLTGWATSITGAAVYANRNSVSNLTDEEGGTINLYAVWAVNTYTVRYNANGGSGNMSDSAFTYGVTQNLLSNVFTRADYRFVGWATSSNGAIEYTNGQAVRNLTSVSGGTVTLYAVWVNAYTIIYNANGGSGDMADSSFILGEPQNLPLNAYSRTGYTFTGWATFQSATSAAYANGQSVTNMPTTAAGTVTLYAVWSGITYTVSYNANGGSSGTMEESAFTYGAAQNLRTNAFARGNNYRFTGWALSPNGPVEYADGVSVINLTATAGKIITLYAVWVNTYTINYSANGSGATGTMQDSVFTYGEAQNIRANAFTRTGYTFTGWARTSSGTVQYTDGQSINGFTPTDGATVTLYAVWRAHTYVVVFDANGGDGREMGRQGFTYGVAQNLRQNTYYTRMGYDFDGWALSPTGGRQYTDMGSVYNLTPTDGAEITLYARWVVNNTYIVVFNSGSRTSRQNIPRDVSRNLNTDVFIFADLRILGWATSPGSSVVYNDGASVLNIAPAGGTINLYAVLTDTYTVIFNGNGATGTMNSITATYGVTQSLPSQTFTAPPRPVTSPSMSYYAFRGWSTSPTSSSVTYYNTINYSNDLGGRPLSATVTLYAVWELVQVGAGS